VKKQGGIYIGIGTNMGDRMANIREACKQITERAGMILKKSSVYVSPPWGFQADNDFYNAVIELESPLEPADLMKVLKEIETGMGRVKKLINVYESRVIDLDILDYKGMIFGSGELRLPHPSLHLRKFVLIPLGEICPEWKHPVSGLKTAELLAGVDSSETIEKLAGAND